jgi:hypothetical protein
MKKSRSIAVMLFMILCFAAVHVRAAAVEKSIFSGATGMYGPTHLSSRRTA